MTAKSFFMFTHVTELDGGEIEILLKNKGHDVQVIRVNKGEPLPAPNEIARYSRHLWNEAPTRLVQGRVVACLRRASVATAVIFPYERSEANWVLTGELQRFEQVVGRDGSASAVVVLELSLSDRSRRDLIWQRRLRSEAPATDVSPGAAVRAFAVAIDGLCGRLVTALGQVR